MPVIPCPVNLQQNDRELYHFLADIQEKLQDKDACKIVSFSQRIPDVDPLKVFQIFAQPNQVNFYWENPKQDLAIAAFETAKCVKINSANRFSQCQEFIQACLSQTLVLNPHFLPEVNPRFFCSFTFQETTQNPHSPFPSATVFLPKLQIIRKQEQSFLVTNLNIYSDLNLSLTLNKLQKILTQLHWLENNFFPRKFFLDSPRTFPTPLEASSFKSAVTSALKSIEANKFSKIVLAHALDVIAPTPFNLVKSLHNLRQKHPDCYTFCTSNGKGHHFIGASPERLLTIHNRQFMTDALAGSASRGATPAQDATLADKLLHSEKEQREHEAVSQFLLQRLQKLGLQPQQSPLQVLQLSNIQHLWTPIAAQIPPNVNPLDIVSQLHPTPAVAGVPTAVACEQIQQYENFDRGLYAAPIGWIDSEGNSEFIVGIRSALIQQDFQTQGRARLYAGAGIVAGSDPEKEVVEIQLKLQTLLKALV